jgi:hypothetical protein
MGTDSSCSDIPTNLLALETKTLSNVIALTVAQVAGGDKSSHAHWAASARCSCGNVDKIASRRRTVEMFVPLIGGLPLIEARAKVCEILCRSIVKMPQQRSLQYV